MSMLIRLVNSLTPYSTDNDVMAVFINGECRGVSYRNKLSNGRVVFLLHIKGTSDETNQPMELRYYCDGLHHLNVTTAIPHFVPNNVLDETYQMDFNIESGSTKYPIATNLTVMLPQTLPFTVNANDMLAVFVGEESRGIGYQGRDLYEGWRATVFTSNEDETAQIRYYSAEKAGTYTILKPFKLNGRLQQENIMF